MTPLSAADFDTLATLLRARSGYAIGADKAYLVETRLLPIAQREGLPDIAALVARLRRPGQEALARDVTEAMTTNETLFFRDDKPFAHMREHSLRDIVAARSPSTPIRIWSAAASTGQEAYSIAILLRELYGLLQNRTVEIVGTDIAREQLARAKDGVYTRFEVQRGLTPNHLSQHFEAVPQGFRVREHLRQMVQFREHNLLADLRPLGKFDIVFCRNVLIYFDQPTKARALDAIAGTMAADGVLYLGAAETVLGISERFVPLPGIRGVYSVAPAPAMRAAGQAGG